METFTLTVVLSMKTFVWLSQSRLSLLNPFLFSIAGALKI